MPASSHRPGWDAFDQGNLPLHVTVAVTGEMLGPGSGQSRVTLGLAQQLISQLVIDQRPAGRLPALSSAGHLRSVSHRVSFREPPFLRLIVRPRHLHGRQDTPATRPVMHRFWD